MNRKEPAILKAALNLFLRHGYRKVTMSDLATASEMSRPSLYAVFANKEAVLTRMITLTIEENEEKTKARLEKLHSLRGRLDCLFDIWIVEPFASLSERENGIELIGNCEEYAPAVVSKIYARFEHYLHAVLAPEMKKKAGLSPKDLAHIVALATQGLKTSSKNLGELRRLSEGLVSLSLLACPNSK